MPFTEARQKDIFKIKEFECPILCGSTLAPVKIRYGVPGVTVNAQITAYTTDDVDLEVLSRTEVLSREVFDYFSIRNWIMQQKTKSGNRKAVTCPLTRRPIFTLERIEPPPIINEFKIALSSGDLKFVEDWISHELPIDEYFIEGVTPLYLAVKFSQINIINLLIANKVDINKGSVYLNDFNPLYLALLNQHIEVVSILLKDNPQAHNYVFETGDYYGMSLVYLAARQGHLEVLAWLIDRGADINKPLDLGKEKGLTPLYIATKYGRMDAVSLLLSRGAKINQRQSHGVAVNAMALHAAIENHHLNLVQLLITNGAQILDKMEDLTTTAQIKQLIIFAKFVARISRVVIYEKLIKSPRQDSIGLDTEALEAMQANLFGIIYNNPNAHVIQNLINRNIKREKKLVAKLRRTDLTPVSVANVLDQVIKDEEKQQRKSGRSFLFLFSCFAPCCADVEVNSPSVAPLMPIVPS